LKTRWIPLEQTFDDDIPPPPWIGQILTVIDSLVPLRDGTTIEKLRPWLPYAAQPVSGGTFFVLVDRSYAPLGLWGGREPCTWFRYNQDSPTKNWIPAAELRLPLLPSGQGYQLAGWFFLEHDAPWNGGQKYSRRYIGRLMVAFNIDAETWELPPITQQWADRVRAEEQFISATEYPKENA